MFLFLLSIPFLWALPNPDLKTLQSPQGWSLHKRIKDKHVGLITVYEKKVDNFPCFRGVGTSQVSLDVFERVAKDVPSATRWSSSGLKESIIIGKTADYVDYYQYLDITFFSDRHWFLRGNFTKGTKQFSMAWHKLPAGAHPDFVAQKKKQYSGAVEPPINVGEWRFTQLADNSIQVEYLICTHPGGSVPKQLRSVGTLKTLPTNVKEMILEGRRRGK